jgi:hypothetical protein
MFRIRIAVAMLATIASISVGIGFDAASQAVAAPGAKTASASAELSAKPRSSAPRVYLVRGFLNVFSLGMDSLADELRSVGISATVSNHASWQSTADEIAADYRAGRRGPIVLIGHSLGADAVMMMGTYLGELGVPVSLIVPFDGTGPHAASANVARVLNFHKSDNVITRGPGFHGELTNYYVSDPHVTHMDIDDNSRLHRIVISKIKG